ncbi:MAG: S-layer homology domain-containing protein, partial [Candidatus Peribacteraceae bacterium]|nr:S-layer homology domain-containing protein [Candidatus Peribacteraceae bacterium]
MGITAALATLLIASSSLGGGPFPDVIGHAQAPQIEELRQRGIVEGYGAGLYRPDVLVNRAEFLKTLELAVNGTIASQEEIRCFTDFTGDTQWFWPFACAAKAQHLVDGYPDGTFRGARTINLAEALKMAVTAWGMRLPVYIRAPDHWYEPYFVAAAGTGIGEYFLNDPGHLLTRGDMAFLLVSLNQPLAVVGSDQSSSSVSSVSSASSVSSVSRRYPYVVPVCGNGMLESGEQCDDGNTQDSDGCSSICIIVPEPVQHSVLRIDQKSQGELNLTGGAKNVSLLSFDAVAKWQDANLTGLKFRADAGSTAAAVNYRLYRDDMGDGKDEVQVAIGTERSGVVQFTSINTLVSTDHATRFEVRADFPSSGLPSTLTLGFDTDNPQYVEAVGDIDGRQLVGIRTDARPCPLYDNCWIAVYTQMTPPVTVVSDRGNLYVTSSNQSVRSHQILLGAASDDLLRLTFRATDEDISVRRLTINGATDDISYLELFDPGAATPFATATSVQCRTVVTGRFCASTAFTVRKDSTKDVIVRAVAKADTEGGKSGDQITLTLSPATTGDVAVEARGVSSEQDLDQNDGNATENGEVFIGRGNAGPNGAITAPASDTVAAKLSGIENADSNPDNSAVPAGRSSIGIFRFRAAPHGNSRNGLNAVNITKLTFSVTATNVLF